MENAQPSKITKVISLEETKAIITLSNIKTPPGFVLPTPPRDLNRHAFLYPNDAILDKKTQDVMIRVWIEPPITGIYCRVHELFPARFFHGLKEGDVLTLSLPNDVNLHLVLDQQNYRYSNHGKFEEVLHKFIFNSFNYSMDSEKGLILLKSLLDLGTSPRRLTEILKKDREDLIKCIETWLSTKCTSLTPKKRSCEDFESGKATKKETIYTIEKHPNYPKIAKLDNALALLSKLSN